MKAMAVRSVPGFACRFVGEVAHSSDEWHQQIAARSAYSLSSFTQNAQRPPGPGMGGGTPCLAAAPGPTPSSQHFVLEQVAQRLQQLQAQLLGQAIRWVALMVTTFCLGATLIPITSG